MGNSAGDALLVYLPGFDPLGGAVKVGNQVRVNTEETALRELTAVLQLVSNRPLSVRENSGEPYAAAVRRVEKALVGGDFFDRSVCPPIRAFAWPILLQSDELATVVGKELRLSDEGMKTLVSDPEEVLRRIASNWHLDVEFDELERIDELSLPADRYKWDRLNPFSRRAMLQECLAKCPVGEWICIQNFFRYFRATSPDFVITTNRRDISHHPWYWLASDDKPRPDSFQILELRYVMCFLFEYMATLGIVDLVCQPPGDAPMNSWRSRRNFASPYLSKYDGLTHFRINSLGAFCLEITEGYETKRRRGKTSLTVYPDLAIHVDGKLNVHEELLLSRFAVQDKAGVWHGEQERLTTAVERMGNLKQLRSFLEERDDQPLPERVEGVLARAERNGRALRQRPAVLLFDCERGELAERIESDLKCAKISERLGDKTIVVPQGCEKKFRRAVRSLGIGFAPEFEE